MTRTLKRIGAISVDAGLCWIGDPCYILHQDQPPKAIGKSWSEFCNILRNATTKQFHHDGGHASLGVVVSTGYGDGVYPVYAEFNEQGRVTMVCAMFIQDNPDEEATD